MGTSLFRGGILMALAVALAACNPDARGFKLPAGDVAAGKGVFVELGCNECHSIANIAHDAAAETGFNLALGGKTLRVKTYGELLTSVINPSHKIARRYSTTPLATDGTSAMRTYNNVMTVQQLVDLVTFLEANYELEVPRSYA